MSYENLSLKNLDIKPSAYFNSMPSLNLGAATNVQTPLFNTSGISSGVQFSSTPFGNIQIPMFNTGGMSLGLQISQMQINSTMQMHQEMLAQALVQQQAYMENLFKQQEQLLLSLSQASTNNQNTIQLTDEQSQSNNPANWSYEVDDLKAKWQSKKPHLTDEFYEKVIEIAKKIKCNPQHLMALMNAESGIKASIKNPDAKSTATGLIQFVESTAKELGTSTADLKQMTEVQQLKYVEAYLENKKTSAGFGKNETIDAGTLYALVFLPGRSKRQVVTTSDEKYYSAGANEYLDLNKDGAISKAELGQRLEQFMA